MARPEVTGRKVTADPKEVGHGEADAYSLEEFARRHRISLKTLYKHPELMPTTFYVGKRRLVSKEAAARWRLEREAAAAAG